MELRRSVSNMYSSVGRLTVMKWMDSISKLTQDERATLEEKYHGKIQKLKPRMNFIQEASQDLINEMLNLTAEFNKERGSKGGKQKRKTPLQLLLEAAKF